MKNLIVENLAQSSTRLFEKPTLAYKLLRLRKDGTLGPLFINRRQVIPLGLWLRAEEHRTKGFAFRPGWHAAPNPEAPHLGKAGRVWAKVELAGVQNLPRPRSQGGTWYLAEWMRVIDVLP